MQYLALAALLALGACAAASGPREDPYVVVEQNASIPNRSLIRRVALYDTDMLLIEVAAGDYYRVRLLPGCADFHDISQSVRIVETGPGIDRSTRFLIGDDTCSSRSIEKVERRRNTATTQAQ